MTDAQVMALAKVVLTRRALEEATAAHDEAVHAALDAGVSLRVVAKSTTVSFSVLSRKRLKREASARDLSKGRSPEIPASISRAPTAGAPNPAPTLPGAVRPGIEGPDRGK